MNATNVPPVLGAQGTNPLPNAPPGLPGAITPFGQAAPVQGGVPAAAQHVVQAPVRHCSFALLYSDPSCDPMWHLAAAILEHFDPMRASPLDAETIL